MGWRGLFDIVIVGARKPAFFTQKSPLFEVVDDAGLLRPHIGKLRDGGAYLGGSAATVEQHLGLSGDDILYVGDHIYADVHVTQRLLRWRTALVVRELEQDLAAIESFEKEHRRLNEAMAQKELLEHNFSLKRLAFSGSSVAGRSRRNASMRFARPPKTFVRASSSSTRDRPARMPCGGS